MHLERRLPRWLARSLWATGMIVAATVVVVRAWASAPALAPTTLSMLAQCVMFSDPAEMYRSSSEVFSGVVLETEPTGIDGAHVPVEIATVRVQEQWKGRTATTVRVATTDRRFQINNSYLFFASGEPLSTSLLCRWTEPSDASAAKLRWLGSLPAREVGDPSPALAPQRFAVLEEAAAAPFWTGRMCSRSGPGSIDAGWMPDADAVVRLEIALARTLAAALAVPSTGGGKRMANEYYRQYAGFVSGGKKRVYINGLHQTTIREPEHLQSWRKSGQIACDGGTLFFGAIYDVESGSITGFSFNASR